MKWTKAIAKIETALSDGANVSVAYHRKWAHNVNEFKYGDVDHVGEYDWHGDTCKAVFISGGMLEEGNFIIDEVLVDYFFNIKYESKEA